LNRFSLELQQALPLIELAATAAFALSGLVEAARKRLDIVGVMVVCFLASFGGGTLRDLLLDPAQPVLNITDAIDIGTKASG
jgi:uncharacterized membrane protein YeiH